jgi:hypothetical protein
MARSTAPAIGEGQRCGGVAIDQALTTIVVTISPGIAGCFQSVLLATQNNSKHSLTLSAAASAGMLSFAIARLRGSAAWLARASSAAHRRR